MSSIILGIAALVAIDSFNFNLVRDIDKQASTLLGADIVISGNREAAPELEALIDSIPGERSSEIELFSMAFMPKSDETQFVRIKALEGGFPYYGKLKTEPIDAYRTFRESQSALVDDGMMIQYNLNPGDTIKLGEASFPIEGRLQSAFGNVGAGSTFAPTVYIPQAFVDSTKLIQPGSFLDYAYYFKTPEDFDPDTWKASKRQTFRNESMRITTIEDRKEDLEEAFNNLNVFLRIVALLALLLGCIGVASSVMIYVKNKVNSIAVFRCLGMKSGDAFFIYFFQVVLMGLFGVLAGAALGSTFQVYLPVIFKDFLPYEIDMVPSWWSIGKGILTGVVITILFALLPLISVRKISPLRTLRSSYEGDVAGKDPLRWAIYGAIILSVFLFLKRPDSTYLETLGFTAGIVSAFMVLFLVSKLIVWAVKKFFPRQWSFVLRQGLSNLYRPNNQTQTLLVSIGLGTAVLTTVFVIRGMLLENVALMDAGNQPNTILFGIERDQKDEIAKVTETYDLPIIQQVPIVTMRLAAWQGRTRAEWLADTSRTASRWAINRETRVSYRDSLAPDESLVAGKFTGHIEPGDSIFVSLSDGYADALDVDIGDELVWNVQGALITTYLGSTRKIEFRSMSTRFFVLFPTGVLEDAPQFQVLVTKSPDTETTARYRSEIVKQFPNVSVIDLGSILVALNDILTKVSYVIQFMAGFSILTGIIVLISSLLLSKFQRIRESVLLRTIGARRKQILQINATEYTLLGTLSAATGVIIALVCSFLLAKFQLEIDYNIQWMPILAIFAFVVALTVFIGLFNSKEVLSKSPLEVLRKEV